MTSYGNPQAICGEKMSNKNGGLSKFVITIWIRMRTGAFTPECFKPNHEKGKSYAETYRRGAQQRHH
jgi:hypothetical protein